MKRITTRSPLNEAQPLGLRLQAAAASARQRLGVPGIRGMRQAAAEAAASGRGGLRGRSYYLPSAQLFPPSPRNVVVVVTSPRLVPALLRFFLLGG